MRILILVAHPDDEVLGMGGTILRHSQKGDLVKVVYFATGISSRRSTNYKNNATYEQEENSDIIQKEYGVDPRDPSLDELTDKLGW